jgi:hypothetical protein
LGSRAGQEDAGRNGRGDDGRVRSLRGSVGCALTAANTPFGFCIEINGGDYPAGIPMLQNTRSQFGLCVLPLNPTTPLAPSLDIGLTFPCLASRRSRTTLKTSNSATMTDIRSSTCDLRVGSRCRGWKTRALSRGQNAKDKCMPRQRKSIIKVSRRSGWAQSSVDRIGHKRSICR